MNTRTQNTSSWQRGLAEYVAITNQQETDSEYLRRVGLKEIVITLCGNAMGLDVLDVGSGDGWLLSRLEPRTGIRSDITNAITETASPFPFVEADVRNLPFTDARFDLVVASLVLMWLPDLNEAYCELQRVLRPGGRVVVAIVHPYFYRTGKITSREHIIINRTLASSWRLDDLKIGGRTGPFTYFYHRYDEYIMAALDAGLHIDSVKDWFIDMRDYKQHINEASKSFHAQD